MRCPGRRVVADKYRRTETWRAFVQPPVAFDIWRELRKLGNGRSQYESNAAEREEGYTGAAFRFIFHSENVGRPAAFLPSHSL